jgi:hypothetical protein
MSSWRSRVRIPALVLLAFAVLFGGLTAVSSAASSTVSSDGSAGPSEGTATEQAALPLGKQRFAIAVGGLRTDSTENWVRLGQYDFAADGTVSERHWHWSQRIRVRRSYTEFRASGCPSRDCTVQTANGYQSTGASKTLEGTYTVSGDTLRITWSGGQWEEWTLTESAGGALAAVEFANSNFGVTHGFGYGSNAGWDARVPMDEIAAADHSAFVHRYHLWKTSEVSEDPYIDEGDGNPFWVTDWTVCGGGNCLGAVTGENTTQYYVSPANSPTGHRRDTLWGWRTANAGDNYCYTGNSHVKPMVQVVDDNGEFHGWVGVEGSLNQTVPDQGALGDDIGVFRIFG